MANFYSDNEDLRFYIERGLDWEPMVRLTEYDYRAPDGFTNAEEAKAFYADVLDMVGQFAANEVAPVAAEIDRQHPTLKDGQVRLPEVQQQIFDQLRELQLHGMCLPRELGGMNTPFLVFMATNELFARGDVSVCAHNGFHGGMAMAMLLYSILEHSSEFDPEAGVITKTRFADEIAEIVSGEAWGSMDITEPGAGSDMAALRTRGEQDADGNWTVTGEKVFITSGHAKYHFVVARTEETDAADAFAGLKGLSMFLVPAYETGEDGAFQPLATFAKLEEKLGHHGSATVAIVFDKTPAQLIGERGDGFRLMLQLMNNARVGVGFECLGVCEAALAQARAYAAERTSMGKTLDRHEMIADYLDEARTDIQAIRALAMEGAFHEEMAQKLRLALEFFPPAGEDEREKMERQQRTHQATARRFTPLVKYYGAEKAVEIARRGIQIHGGYGYSTEYPAEKLLRDAVVMPIYEGTSQIQALMAMKDTLMGVLKDPRAFVAGRAKASWRARRAPTRLERRVARLQVLQGNLLLGLMTRLTGKKLSELRGRPMAEWTAAFQDWDPKRDFAVAMLHAERLTQVLCDVAIAEVLLRQARKFPERTELLERFLERAEPRCRYRADEIGTTGKRLLAALRGDEDAEAKAS